MFGVSEICFLYTDAPLGSLEMPSDGPASFRGPDWILTLNRVAEHRSLSPAPDLLVGRRFFAIEVGGPNLSR
jgi:hypothetical protein